MSASTKSVLIRAGYALGAVVVAFVIAFLTGPDAASLVPKGYEFLVAGVLIPALAALEKLLTNKKVAKKASKSNPPAGDPAGDPPAV